MKVHVSLIRALLALAPLLLPDSAAAGAESARHENVRFSRLTLEEGLSQTNVSSVVQDELGFVWLGTEDGLNRYDGRNVRVYTHSNREPDSLGHSWVSSLLISRRGELLVGTSGGGLDRWRPATDDFEHLTAGDDSLGRQVRALLEDARGNLWIGTETGLIRRSEDGTTRLFKHDPRDPGSLPGDTINVLFEDRDGALWVGATTGGLGRLDSGRETFIRFRNDPLDPTSLPHDDVRAITQRRDGSLWVGTYGGGAAKYRSASASFVRFQSDDGRSDSLSHDRVRALLEDSREDFWLATDDGLNRLLDEEDGSFQVLRNDPSDSRSLSSDRVRTLFQDRGGVVWVGTQTGGVSWFNPEIGYFPHYRRSSDSAFELSDNTITSFLEEDGNTLWVGTMGGGLNTVDLLSGEASHYRKGESRSSLSDDRIMALETGSGTTLWIGTFGGGLNRLDKATGEVQRYQHDPARPGALSASGIMSLHRDRDGRLWVGTFRGGLDRLESDGSFTVFPAGDEPGELSDDSVTVITEGDDDILWLGTRLGGLNRFDRATGRAVSYRHDARDLSSLASDLVSSLHLDSRGDLWIGTDEGLHRWSAADRRAGLPRFDKRTEGEGVLEGRIWGILEDTQHDLWISTDRGLARLGLDDGQLRLYDSSRGLQSNEFNFGAYHVGASGRLYFGGVNGFNAFRPEDIRHNRHVPPVVLTSLRKLNQPITLGSPIWEIDQLDLGHRDYVVSIGFAALDYTAPQLNRYQYMLEGLEDEWVSLDDPRATFARLSPGNYTLRLRASNNEGTWNEQGATLRMRVRPPLWRSSGAFVLYGLAGLALLFLYARAQALKLRREASYSRQLEDKVRERTQELEEATLTDALTGLKNRRYLMTRVADELREIDRVNAERAPDEPTRNVLFLMIDLDGLKQINDTHGHASGDCVIMQMRGILEGACRQTDTVIRLGGDEFLVVGRDVNRETAEKLAERVRMSVETTQFQLEDGGSTTLSCSIGFAFYPFVDEEPGRVSGDQVVTIADRALYVAKTSGRNAWVGIHGTTKTLREDLGEALQSGLQGLVARDALTVGSSVHEGKLVWGQESGLTN